MKNPSAVALGRLGGKAGTKESKARSSEQARAAVRARWPQQRFRVSATYFLGGPARAEETVSAGSPAAAIRKFRKARNFERGTRLFGVTVKEC